MPASAEVHQSQQAELLHAVLESTAGAAIVWDAAGDTYLANHQALELHGLPPAGAPFDTWGAFYEARRPDGAVVPHDELPLVQACRGEAVRGVRLAIRPRLGPARTVDVRALPLRDADAQLIGAMSVFRDVEELRHAQEPFRKVFEEGPVGMVVFGEDLAIRDANPAFCTITGYAHDELVARSVIDLVEAADVAFAFEQAERLFSGAVHRYRAEQRCLTRGGGAVWTSVTATVVRDDAGAPLYAVAIVEDISERKRIEQLMISQNERLSADLETSLDELQISRARILATADLERRRIERDLHDGAQQRLVALRVRLGLAQDLLRDDPVRGAALLSDLGGDVDAAIEEVRLLARGVYPSVLAHRGLVDALRTAARTSPLPVSVRSHATERYPVDVETAVYFTCVEALQNAAKHAGPGTAVRISVTSGATLRFEVRDNGAGFALNGERPGTGLANMRDRIESVGGELSVASIQGEGTCVSGGVPLR